MKIQKKIHLDSVIIIQSVLSKIIIKIKPFCFKTIIIWLDKIFYI